MLTINITVCLHKWITALWHILLLQLLSNYQPAYKDVFFSVRYWSWATPTRSSPGLTANRPQSPYEEHERHHHCQSGQGQMIFDGIWYLASAIRCKIHNSESIVWSFHEQFLCGYIKFLHSCQHKLEKTENPSMKTHCLSLSHAQTHTHLPARSTLASSAPWPSPQWAGRLTDAPCLMQHRIISITQSTT